MTNLIQSNAFNIPLDDKSCHMVCTSPPYFSLRRYAGEQEFVFGGDKGCAHEWGEAYQTSGRASSQWGSKSISSNVNHIMDGNTDSHFCHKCNAWRGAYGLEPTLQMYIDHTVEWCREVYRVLRDDGVFFLNLGDSYMGSGGAHKSHHANPGLSKSSERDGVPHVKSYDNSGKEPVNYQDHGCLCGSLCDVCLVVHRHKFRKDDWLVPTLIASLSETTRERMEFEPSRLPTLDFSLLASRLTSAILGLLQIQAPSDEQLLAFQESMPDEFSRQLLDECLQRDSRALCLWCAHSLVSDGKEFADKSPAHHSRNSLDNQDKISAGVSPERRNQNKGKACEYCVETYPDYTITSQLKEKDLMGVPWRIALALQADGWYLRSDIIWYKPNPMPESVTDRPTKSHEYLFLLTKKPKYYYDADAIREISVTNEGRPHGIVRDREYGYDSKQAVLRSQRDSFKRSGNKNGQPDKPQKRENRKEDSWDTSGRNKRTVWDLEADEYLQFLNWKAGQDTGSPDVWKIATAPYKGAHFATYPPALVEPCIKAGTSEKGVCPECGNPWERELSKRKSPYEDTRGVAGEFTKHHVPVTNKKLGGQAMQAWLDANPKITLGWEPTCDCCQVCDHYNQLHGERKCPVPFDPIPATVLDIFSGSGTTIMVARKLGRNGIGLDLSTEYIDLAKERLGIKDGLPGFEHV